MVIAVLLRAANGSRRGRRLGERQDDPKQATFSVARREQMRLFGDADGQQHQRVKGAIEETSRHGSASGFFVLSRIHCGGPCAERNR